MIDMSYMRSRKKNSSANISYRYEQSTGTSFVSQFINQGYKDNFGVR